MQMIFELACIILLGLMLACCFVVITRPVFSGLLNITIEISQLIYIFMVCGICIFALALLVGFILFFFFFFFLLRYRAKGKLTGQFVWRRLAVTIQLAVSVVLIVAASVMMKQMRFVNRKDLGFDQRGIIQLSEIIDYSRGRTVWTALRRELEAIPQIEIFTQTYFEPKYGVTFYDMLTELKKKKKLSYENPAFHTISVDNRFTETFGLKMLAGKWFDEGGTHKVVLNEEAVRVMGLSEPVGAIIRLHPENDLTKPMEDYEIVGVVNDFHTLSLRSRILPTIFLPFTYTPLYTTYIHVVPGQEQEAMRRIKTILPDIDVSMADVRLTPLG
jgi:putative ABC transport system permease protein